MHLDSKADHKNEDEPTRPIVLARLQYQKNFGRPKTLPEAQRLYHTLAPDNGGTHGFPSSPYYDKDCSTTEEANEHFSRSTIVNVPNSGDTRVDGEDKFY